MLEHYPLELLELIRSVTAHRPRIVLQHILEHGAITTEELASLYNYNHPPRAARDVREHGIPLRTERVRGQSGRNIARYTIDVDEFIRRQAGNRRGRRAFPTVFKRTLAESRGYKCEVCLTTVDPIDLQVDHRVPYEVGGDPPLTNLEAFMLICASCNREKSWRCEHCPNWTQQSVETCEHCFWANPSSYTHVAMVNRLAVVIAFNNDDMELYRTLEAESEAKNIPIADIIKDKLRTLH